MNSLLTLLQLTKQYQVGDSRIQALRGVDLSLEAGEFVAVGGPSGSGKSTLLNICGLLDRSDSGEHQFLGQAIARLKSHALTQLRRDSIGFVFQHFNLIPVLSALENVEYPLMLTGLSARERRQRAAQLLMAVGLADYQHHVPDRLSGGQRQRVAVARALVKHPRLIIADEPTANLDTQTANQIIDLMQTLSTEQGTTFLIATHDERMVKRCSRSLHLLDGVLQA